jgi:hypothetical protein
MEHNENKQET